MGRHTDEPKDRAIGVRLNAELSAFFVDRGGNISENVRKALTEYVKQNNDCVKQNNPKQSSSVKQNNDDYVKQNKELEHLKQKFSILSTRVRPEADEYFKNDQYTILEIVPVGYCDKQSGCGSLPKGLYDHIMSMVGTYGMSYEEFMKIIDVFLDKCYIQDDGGTLKTIDSKLDTSGFIAKCEEYGIKDYQTVFDRMVKQMKAN